MGMRAGKERVRTGREAQQIVALALALALSLALASGATAARECEGPGINHLPEPATSDEVLSVIAYNVYLLPSHVRAIPFMGERFAIAQEERAERIPPFLAPYDVVILSEAYDDDARAMLLDGLRARGFRYSTRILGSACRAASSCKKGTVYEQPLTEGEAPRGGEGDSWFGEDGGVLIASKHPIGAASEWVYADCVEPDCNAAKGFVYARIDKGSARYHVIGTHAQFGWNTEQREAKAAQLSAIRQFLENESGIPRSEPVIVGGDFNVLRHEFDGLLNDEPLGMLAPTFRGHRYTRETRSDWAQRGNGYVDYVLAKQGLARAPLQQQLPDGLPHALRLRGSHTVLGRERRGLLRPLGPLGRLGLFRLPGGRRGSARMPRPRVPAALIRAGSRGSPELSPGPRPASRGTRAARGMRRGVPIESGAQRKSPIFVSI